MIYFSDVFYNIQIKRLLKIINYIIFITPYSSNNKKDIFNTDKLVNIYNIYSLENIVLIYIDNMNKILLLKYKLLNLYYFTYLYMYYFK